MFAASLPLPSHNLPGSALATGIRDALTASSFRAHVHQHAQPVKPARKAPRRPKKPVIIPVHLLPQANALCAILGVPPFPLVKERIKPALGIGADALARIRVADDDVLQGEVGAKLAKRLENRARRRAKALVMAGR